MLDDMQSFQVYGLRIRTNLLLPCHPALPDSEFDVLIEAMGPVDALADAGTLLQRKDFESVWKKDEQVWQVAYGMPDHPNLAVFEINPLQRHIRVSWVPSVAISTIFHILLGPVLGAWLRLNGRLGLHGGAAVAGTRAFVLLGSSGSGKSSTLTALLHAGCKLVTDDLAVVEEWPDGTEVHPGPLFVRVWPDTAQVLGYNPEQLRRVFEDEPSAPPKRLLEYNTPDNHAWRTPAHLHRIYVLERQQALRKVEITPLLAKDALHHLLQHVYAGHYLDVDTRPLTFGTCVRLAHSCSVRKVQLPDDLNNLPQLAQALLADLEGPDPINSGISQTLA